MGGRKGEVLRSLQNPVVRELLAVAEGKRRAEGFFLEGPRAVADAVAAGFPVARLVLREGQPAPGDVPATVPVVYVGESVFRRLADTETPQGVLALVHPRLRGVAEVVAGGGAVIVAWGVQDPGNVGTIVRSAAVFGLGGVVVGPGTADPFGVKAVRASAGAVLAAPLARAQGEAELLAALRRASYEAYWTGAEGRLGPDAIRGRERVALFVGSEGAGLPESLRAAIGKGISLPMRGRPGSLNAGVAASILAYELRSGEASARRG